MTSWLKQTDLSRESCLFSLYNYKQASPREKERVMLASVSTIKLYTVCWRCAAAHQHNASLKLEYSWPYSLYQDRLVPVSQIEEEAHCVNACCLELYHCIQCIHTTYSEYPLSVRAIHIWNSQTILALKKQNETQSFDVNLIYIY